MVRRADLEYVKGADERCCYFTAQPLIPHAVTIYLLTRRRNIKVSWSHNVIITHQSHIKSPHTLLHYQHMINNLPTETGTCASFLHQKLDTTLWKLLVPETFKTQLTNQTTQLCFDSFWYQKLLAWTCVKFLMQELAQVAGTSLRPHSTQAAISWCVNIPCTMKRKP